MFQKTRSLCIPCAAAALVLVTNSTVQAQSGTGGSGINMGKITPGKISPIGINPIGIRPGGINSGPLRFGPINSSGFYNNRGIRTGPGLSLGGSVNPFYSNPDYGGSVDYPNPSSAFFSYPPDGPAADGRMVYPDAYVAPLAVSPAARVSPTPALPLRAKTSVRVTVPADAQVWFDGKPTTTTGSVREFNTPPLKPGSQYSFAIRARWNENGREVNQTQQVQFVPGQFLDVSFPAPPMAENASADQRQ